MPVWMKQNHVRWILDLKSVFVNASLKEHIHVREPDGFEQAGEEDWVYVLRKILNGLCQLSR